MHPEACRTRRNQIRRARIDFCILPLFDCRELLMAIQLFNSATSLRSPFGFLWTVGWNPIPRGIGTHRRPADILGQSILQRFCHSVHAFPRTTVLLPESSRDRDPILCAVVTLTPAPGSLPRHGNGIFAASLRHPWLPGISTKKARHFVSKVPGVILATTYSRTSYRSTTIGSAAFHFRVRNGNGWVHCARSPDYEEPPRRTARCLETPCY